MTQPEAVVYFEDASKGEENTRRVVEIVGVHLKAHPITHVVMASNTGYVAAQFAALAKANPKVSFIAVKMAPAVDKIYDVTFDEGHRRTMEAAGIRLVTGTHALTGGVDRALRRKFDGGFPPGAIIAETLYLFSQGMKVAVEIIAMAVDSGLLPEGAEVISCAGTGHGADTAIHATAASSTNLFDMGIHRILAMPLRK
jgi:hypothetical protein